MNIHKDAQLTPLHREEMAVAVLSWVHLPKRKLRVPEKQSGRLC